MTRRLLTVLAFALVASSAQAQGPGPVQVGTLECNVSAGLGLILGSQRQMRCTFNRGRRGSETYVGRITRFGLDIGVTTGGLMVWTVFAPSTDFARGALAGRFAGASAEATVGGGVGANVLVGGGARSFSLQPVSVQAQTGLNLAVGVAGLTLAPARPRAAR